MSVAHRQSIGYRRPSAARPRGRQRLKHVRHAVGRGAAEKPRNLVAWLTSLDWTSRNPMSDRHLLRTLLVVEVAALAAGLLAADVLASWAKTSGDLVPAVLCAVLVAGLLAAAAVPVRGELRRRRGDTG